MTTNRSLIQAACAALVGAIAFATPAQESSDSSLEVTIRLLPENAASPGDLTRQIELPPAARPNRDGAPADPAGAPQTGAEENRSNERDNGRANGRDVAAEARERGRDFGQEVAEQARENRENAGRPDDAGPPQSPPGNPPGPPATPPGQQ